MSFVEEIELKYATKEKDLMEKINLILEKENQLDLNETNTTETNQKYSTKGKTLSLEEAIKRNKKLMKELSKCKARLRSHALFCASEIMLKECKSQL